MNQTYTEGNESSSRSKTLTKLNKTMMTEVGSKKISSINKTIEDLKQDRSSLK